MRIDKDIENLKKLAGFFEKLKQLSEENIKLNKLGAPQEDRNPGQMQYDNILFSDDLQDVIKDIYLMAEAFMELRKVTNESVEEVKKAEIDYDCLTHQFCC